MVGMRFTRVLRAAVVAAGITVVVWTVRAKAGRAPALHEIFPPIGSDTWPPVPANPDRPH